MTIHCNNAHVSTLPLLQLQEADKVQKAVVQQQVQTWELLHVLYSAIDDTSDVQLDSRPTFVEMKRREGLSSWLQVCCCKLCELATTVCAAYRFCACGVVGACICPVLVLLFFVCPGLLLQILCACHHHLCSCQRLHL